MRRPNIIFAALAIALALFALIYAVTTFPSGPGGVPGPGVFPIIIAVALILVALVVMVNYARSKDNKPVDWVGEGNRRTYLSLLAMIAYVFLLPIVGFLTMTTLFLTGIIKWYGRRSWWLSALIALLISGVIFVLFQFVFRVRLQFGFLI